MSLLLDELVVAKYNGLKDTSPPEVTDLLRDVITHAISQIRQATEVSEVKEELGLVVDLLIFNESSKLALKYNQADLLVLGESFSNAHELYTEWLKFLIEYVNIEWGYCFTQDDKLRVLEPFFTLGSPSICFLALCQSIRLSDAQTEQRHGSAEQVLLSDVSRLLLPFTEHKLVQVLLELNTTHTCMRYWPLLLVHVTSLGDRLVNRLARRTEPRFLAPQYSMHVCDQVLAALQSETYRRPVTGTTVTLDWDHIVEHSVVWPQLLGKLATLGHADAIVSRIVDWLMSPKCQSVIWRVRLAKILEQVPDSQLENLIGALVTRLSHFDLQSARDTLAALLQAVSHKSTVRYQLTNKLLVHRPLDAHAHLLLVDYLYDSLPRELFVQTLIELATTWSRQHLAEAQLIVLTRALGRGLARLGTQAQHEMRLLTTIFEGVSTHLATPPSVTRQSAESLAALAARLTAPDISPPFEDKPPRALGIGDDWLTVTRVTEGESQRQSQPSAITPAADLTAQQPARPKTWIKKQPDMDPDQLYLEDDAASDDSLPDYNELEDDASDLSDVKVPVYLRDCLNNLLTDEPDVLEVTLNNLPALLRRAPDDLDELSVPLASALVHLNNQYQLHDFDKSLTDSLVALVVGSTVKVVTFLTAQFYASNYSLQQRMLMLDVLARGARELSALPKPVAATPARGTQSLVVMTGTVTCVSSRPAPPKTAVNRFAPHAGLFIYPLLQNYDRKSALLDLYHQDGIVLGQLLYSLGVFVECLGGNATALTLTQLARTLLEVVWTLRHHPAPTVRRSLLYLTTTLCGAVPRAVLAADGLRSELTELLAWGVSVAKDEADEDCRLLATALVSRLVPLFNGETLQLED